MANVAVAVRTIDNKTPAICKIIDNETTMASTNTYMIENDGTVMLYAYGGAAGGNLTIQTPQTVDGLAVAESVIALAASKSYVFGPFPSKTYNQADGCIYLTSSVEDFKIMPFKMSS